MTPLMLRMCAVAAPSHGLWQLSGALPQHSMGLARTATSVQCGTVTRMLRQLRYCMCYVQNVLRLLRRAMEHEDGIMQGCTVW
jgi:hypothetical protein